MSVEELLCDGFGPVNLETTIHYHHELRGGDEVGVSCAFVWGVGKTHRVGTSCGAPTARSPRG